MNRRHSFGLAVSLALLLGTLSGPVSAQTPTILNAFTDSNTRTPSDLTVSAGSNRWAVCVSRYGDSTDGLSTAQFRGQSMTINTSEVNGSDRLYVSTLNEAGIAAGSGNAFSFTYSPGNPGTGRMVHECGVIQNASQSPLTIVVNTDGVDPVSTNITGVANSFGVAYYSNRHGNAATVLNTWSGDFTELLDGDDSTDQDVTVSMATANLSAGTNTATVNPNSSPTSGTSATTIILRFDPVAAGGGATPLRRRRQ